MKSKRSHSGNPNESQGIDRCYTPAYAIDPLLPYLKKEWTIWEPANGQGHISRVLAAHGFNVVMSEIQNDPAQNFFTYQPPHFDCIVTNPPYSIKAEWLARCYQLGRPFALLIPLDSLAARSCQKYAEKYGAEINLLNRRVNFIRPEQGNKSDSSPFPVYWHTWHMTGKAVDYWKITRRSDQQLALL